MSNWFCYICGNELQVSDLAVPVNVVGPLPFGRVEVVVFSHYMCGLNCYLDVDLIPKLQEKDRVAIEAKLMEVLLAIGKGTTQ